MTPLNVATHEHEANDMRLGEIHRFEDLAAANLRLCGHIASVAFVSGLTFVSESLRPLFSWNPDE
jgi:hypothetical protein